MEPTEFDEYSDNYDEALEQGISVSGEGKEYFAQNRIAWLARCLEQFQTRPARIIDYGCGTGSATPYFLDLMPAASILGLDVSTKSLELAKRTYGSDRTSFLSFAEYVPSGEMDVAFCNGVFHHIPPLERVAAIESIHRSLRKGGLFALWENNPWNPGSRYVMSRIPFDRDAIPLSAPETRRLLRAGNFEILRTDFLFIFPRLLRWFRPLEPLLSRLPLGAQYQVLCRKP